MNRGTLFIILLNTQIFMTENKPRISELKQFMEVWLVLNYLKIGILSLLSMTTWSFKLTNWEAGVASSFNFL